jgi:hypothetical protein
MLLNCSTIREKKSHLLLFCLIVQTGDKDSQFFWGLDVGLLSCLAWFRFGHCLVREYIMFVISFNRTYSVKVKNINGRIHLKVFIELGVLYSTKIKLNNTVILETWGRDQW